MKARVTKVLSDTAPRVEGEPFYALHRFQLASDVAFSFRCFEQLPLIDAVGLLSGDDQTGLIVWEGTLRLLQYLYETKYLSSRSRCAALTILELGCGCGALSTGAVQVLQCETGESESHSVFIATDGNDDCVELAHRNLLSIEPKTFGKRLAVSYWWDSTLPAVVTEHLVGPLAKRHCIVLSGDVIYSPEAIVPLVRSVQRIADAADHHVTWLLSYIPRSLTKAANDHIFDELKKELCSLNTVGTNAFFPIPSSSTDEESNDESRQWWMKNVDILHDTFRDNGFVALLTVCRNAV
ncbi:methyltransferase, putative [Bodo saltans]|uniref:Methyltransferase, putative n=1 Tax=Bodo saltans TaxID=75058 RepID=A0A0S4JFN7_BODSA|nr:methyltransferase, putative [Bodo saltans]|eukprot:CUG87204.1 methyltransferase, putative [Bodo saltans]